MRYAILFLLLFPLLAVQVRGGTYTAASCSYADVNGLINNTGGSQQHLAVDGDIIIVPSCPGGVTWSTTLLISAAGITLQGQTICTGTPPSSCTDNTVITMGSGIKIDVEGANATHFVRITGLTIKSSGTCDVNNGIITFNGDNGAVAFRDDHNHYVNSSCTVNTGLITHIGVYGLHDHLVIDDSLQGGHPFWIYGDWATAGFLSWQRPAGWGTNQAVYFEDNTFNLTNQSDGTQDGSAGGRMVFRHNQVNENGNCGSSDVMGTHGTDSGGYRSFFSSEVYSNTFSINCSANNNGGTPASPMTAFRMRGGSGLLFSNTYNGSLGVSGYNLQNYRADGGSNTGTWGVCNGTNWELQSIDPTTTQGRTTSTSGGTYFVVAHRDSTTNSVTTAFFDGNPGGSGASGYACRDSIGRTHDQALAPVYAWLNGSVTMGTSGTNGALLATYVVQNQDWYDYQTAGCSGTQSTGVCSSVLSSRATNCTAGVGFWATDTNTLYVCNPTNTWTSYYTPYTYPHPLAGSPIATFTPSSVNAGQVPAGLSGNPIPVTLQNTGSSNLVATAVSLGSAVFSLTSNTCGSPATITNSIPGTGFTLTPSATCTFNVVYSPVLPNFTNTSFVSFADNAGNPDIFNLSGTSTGTPAPAVTMFAGNMSSSGTVVVK
jgi:hypothetical protein